MSSADDRAHGQRGVFGTGLPMPALVAVLTVSVLIFLFWDGALWSAPTGASHLGRILVSYLAIPLLLVIAQLVVRKKIHLGPYFTALALVVGVKLVVTASLYSYFGTGSAKSYTPETPWKTKRGTSIPQITKRYRPAESLDGFVAISGTVISKGKPVRGAVVLVEEPAAGAPLAAPTKIQMVIGKDGQHQERLYLATTHDKLEVINQSSSLHTLRFLRGNELAGNHPIPAGGESVSISPPPKGEYVISCAAHPHETAELIVVDHPYASKTDDEGRFSLPPLAPGKVMLSVDAGPLGKKSVELSDSERDQKVIELSAPTAEAPKVKGEHEKVD